jgi:hypothetical protein
LFWLRASAGNGLGVAEIFVGTNRLGDQLAPPDGLPIPREEAVNPFRAEQSRPNLGSRIGYLLIHVEHSLPHEGAIGRSEDLRTDHGGTMSVGESTSRWYRHG